MLKNLREKSKLNQTQLSFLSGISIKTISRIENGDTNVQYSTLLKLAEFFEVNVEEIISNKKD